MFSNYLSQFSVILTPNKKKEYKKKTKIVPCAAVQHSKLTSDLKNEWVPTWRIFFTIFGFTFSVGPLPTVNPIVFDVIDDAMVMKAAQKTKEGSGTSGLDADG